MSARKLPLEELLVMIRNPEPLPVKGRAAIIADKLWAMLKTMTKGKEIA